MVWISNGRDYSLSWKPWLFENPDHLKSDLQKVRISNGRTSDPHCSWTLKKIEQKNIDLVNLFQLSRRAAQPSSSFRTCARCSASTLRWTNRRATDQQGLQSKRKVRNQFYPNMSVFPYKYDDNVRTFYPDCRLTKTVFLIVSFFPLLGFPHLWTSSVKFSWKGWLPLTSVKLVSWLYLMLTGMGWQFRLVT